jgi:hypothetical protein
VPPRPDSSTTVSDPKPSPSPSPIPFAEPLVDSRLVPQRATDADGPRAVVVRGVPPIAGLTGYRWPISNGRVTLPFKAIPGGEFSKDGKLVAERALKAGVIDVVFDRGGYIYHGRVKALADAAREAGLNF